MCVQSKRRSQSPGGRSPFTHHRWAKAPLLPDARLILEPQLDALSGIGFGRGAQGVAEPLFRKASCAFRSVLGCTGRAFCRESPRRLRTRDMLCGAIVLPNFRSIQRFAGPGADAIAIRVRPSVDRRKERRLLAVRQRLRGMALRAVEQAI